jgi:hypothetical protein
MSFSRVGQKYPYFSAILKRELILSEKAARLSLVLKKTHRLDAKGEE